MLPVSALGSPDAGGVLMRAFAVGGLAGSLTLGRVTTVAPRPPGRRGIDRDRGGPLASAALTPSVAWTAAAFAAAGVCDGPPLTATLRLRSE